MFSWFFPKTLKHIGSIPYQMALPPNLPNLHDVFHVSQLRKYNSDLSHLLEPESVRLREGLTFNLSPSLIMDHRIKQLRNKTIPLVKVAWGRRTMEEHTQELVSKMKKSIQTCLLVMNFEDKILLKKRRNITSPFLHPLISSLTRVIRFLGRRFCH